MKGARECPQCGQIGWKQTGSFLFKCNNGHTFGNKYNAQRPDAGPLSKYGDLIKRFGSMDSKLEGDYFLEHLAWLEKLGEAKEVHHHTVIHLLPNFSFKTDWDYIDKNGVLRYADTKGPQSERFKAILDIWPIFGWGPLDVVKRGKRGFVTRTYGVGKWTINPGPTSRWEFQKVA